MAKYVKISPLTRLEGHLGITARINDGKVSAAYSHGEMFRGLETILIGRDPRDAPIITSRTCGVCHFVHRHTSLRAIENAAGFAFPMPQAADVAEGNWSGLGKLEDEFPGYLYSGEDGGGTKDPRWLDADRSKKQASELDGDRLPVGAQLARNIVHGLTYVYSHAAHTIALAAPDYKWYIDEYVNKYADTLSSDPFNFDVTTVKSDGSYDESGATGSFFDAFYKEAVVAQRILHEILGFLGGKVPHQQSAIPGGFSRSFKGQLTTDTLAGGTDMDAIANLAMKEIPINGDTSQTAYHFLSLDGVLMDAGLSGYTRPTAIGQADWIARRAALFTVALAVGGHLAGATLWGRGSDNFVCAPTFDIVQGTSITGDAYFRGGVKLANEKWYGLDPTKYGSDTDGPGEGWMFIYEDITSGKYPETDDFTEEPKCGGTAKYPKLGYPGDTETHPSTTTHGLKDRYTYTWYKATRAAYHKDSNGDGEPDEDADLTLYPVESGPFARLVVNGVDPNLGLGGTSIPVDLSDTTAELSATGLRYSIYDIAGDASLAWKSTTWNRLIGRVQDMLMIIDMLVGSNYSGENSDGGYLSEINEKGCWLARLHLILGDSDLTDDYGIKAEHVVKDPPKDVAWENLDGQGCAYWDAPRGITCHFCKVEDGLLTQYQHIAGTTWNGNGRDQQDNPGPFEWSLMGMLKVEDTDGDGESNTLPGVDTSGEDLKLTENSGGNWSTTLKGPTFTGGAGPVCERTVYLTYELNNGGSWRRYYASDVPKHIKEEETGADQGQIRGEGILGTSYIDYTTGGISLDFKFNYDYPDYSHIRDVRVIRYGFASNPVPTPAAWANGDGYSGYGYSGAGDEDRPNPINILRTIRSYDPCLACSIHVVDKKGKVGKYEAVPVAGWEVK